MEISPAVAAALILAVLILYSPMARGDRLLPRRRTAARPAPGPRRTGRCRPPSSLSGWGRRRWLDAGIVLVIVTATAALGFTREYSAQAAAAALRTRVQVQSVVIRDGAARSVPSTEIVPGDVVLE